MGGVVGYSRHNRNCGNTSSCSYWSWLCTNVSDKVSKDASKYLAEDQKAIDESIKRMKGMRQFGKFNRQKWEK